MTGSIAIAARAPRAAWLVCAAALLLSPAVLAAQGPAGGKRGVATNMTTLLVDGVVVNVGPVVGGTVYAHVVSNNLGPDNVAKKHVTGIAYDDIVAQVPVDAKPVTDWIRAMLDGKATPKTGSIVTGDQGGAAVEERLFLDALLTEVTFPALDGASGESGYVTVTIAPERLSYRKGSGAVAKQGTTSKVQRWTTNAFRVEMDGLDGTRVVRVEPITARRRVDASQVGILREPTKTASALEVSNIRLTMTEPSAQSWADWNERFLIQGQNGEADEKNGAIVLLSPDMKGEVARIPLGNCGIVRLAPAEGGSPGAVRRMTAELYCERIGFQVNAVTGK